MYYKYRVDYYKYTIVLNSTYMRQATVSRVGNRTSGEGWGSCIGKTNVGRGSLIGKRTSGQDEHQERGSRIAINVYHGQCLSRPP